MKERRPARTMWTPVFTLHACMWYILVYMEMSKSKTELVWHNGNVEHSAPD